MWRPTDMTLDKMVKQWYMEKFNYTQENLTFEHPKFQYNLKFRIMGI